MGLIRDTAKVFNTLKRKSRSTISFNRRTRSPRSGMPRATSVAANIVAQLNLLDEHTKVAILTRIVNNFMRGNQNIENTGTIPKASMQKNRQKKKMHEILEENKREEKRVKEEQVLKIEDLEKLMESTIRRVIKRSRYEAEKENMESSTPHVCMGTACCRSYQQRKEPTEEFIPVKRIKSKSRNETQGPRGEISLDLALRIIPQFDGSPDKLGSFCAIVRRVLARFGEDYEQIILDSLINKISGRAASAFITRLPRYTKIESLLSDLTAQYGNIGLAEDIIMTLRFIKQAPGESACDFGQRVQILLNQLTTVYEATESLSRNDQMSRIREAEANALERFLQGLNPLIEIRVRCKKPSNLNEAIKRAIEYEYGQTASIPTHTVNRMGVSEKQEADAGRLLESPPPSNFAKIFYYTAESNPRILSNEQENFLQYPQTKLAKCEYCRRTGHRTSECKTLALHINQGRIEHPRFANRNRENFAGANDSRNIKFNTPSNFENPPNQCGNEIYNKQNSGENSGNQRGNENPGRNFGGNNTRSLRFGRSDYRPQEGQYWNHSNNTGPINIDGERSRSFGTSYTPQDVQNVNFFERAEGEQQHLNY